MKPPIAIAGASGFVGTHLRRLLASDFRFKALTRSESLATMSSEEFSTDWHYCDLYSLPQLENALSGTECAIYLVHSMLPSSRLNQSSFEDLDLILADNFARAAAKNRLSQIIYLSGLVPNCSESEMSVHLRSRLEVEQTLGSTGVPVTTIRTGLIVGPGGSSLKMLVNLVRRLPAMVLPKWVHSETQSIAIEDIARAVRHTIGNQRRFTGSFDVCSNEHTTYRDMIETTARIMGKKRLLINVPVYSVRFSQLWIEVFSGAPRTLTRPLVSSLKHSLQVTPNPLLDYVAPDAMQFEEALRQSIDASGKVLPTPREQTKKRDVQMIRAARRVRSVQRLPLPPGHRAADIVRIYMEWLPRVLRPILRITALENGGYEFWTTFPSLRLLQLTPSPITKQDDRRVFYITGGWLANTKATPPGRLEFREVMDRKNIITAIHGYRPSLQWHFYNVTQALLHVVIMKSFGRHLRRLARKQKENASGGDGSVPQRAASSSSS